MVYTDPPMRWPYRGRMVKSCHLTADTLAELHAFALKIGLRRAYFQNKPGFPHYDLMSERTRKAAADAGAVALTRDQVYARFKARQAAKTTEGGDR